MSGKSKIEWTTRTWNPITGCTKVSSGCLNCYAEKLAHRFAGMNGYPKIDSFKPTIHPNRFKQPAGWSKPCMVFVCSMGDLFHPDIPRDVIHFLLGIMFQAKDFTFQILTKRARRAKRLLAPFFSDYGPPENIWVGVTAENQRRAEERIPYLMEIPAKVRFVSVEPMLGPIDLSYFINGCPEKWGDPDNPEWQQTCPGIDWVICGGESGQNARPMHPYWAQDLRDECIGNNVPFFFKQWGEWISLPQSKDIDMDGSKTIIKTIDINGLQTENTGMPIYHVGKKAAGSKLDGKKYKEFPKI